MAKKVVKKPSQREKEVAKKRMKKHAPAIVAEVERIDKLDKQGKVKRIQDEAPEPREIEEAPEVPEPPTTGTLLCCDCSLPILASDMPVVLEWGKRKDGLNHLAPPIRKAKHQDCDRLARGKAIPSRTAEQQSSAAPAVPKAPREKSAPVDMDGKTIHRIVTSNPRKPDTWGWKSFNVIKDGMTVADYLKAGGRKNDLAWDLDHKFVELR